MTTKNSTYANAGTMQDYLKFLMSNAEKTQKAEGYYRCYCKILHEYQDFQWFDENKTPHIIDGCDAFEKHTGDIEETENTHNKKPMAQHSAVKQKSVMVNS